VVASTLAKLTRPMARGADGLVLAG
jgi:hypothetical protein